MLDLVLLVHPVLEGTDVVTQILVLAGGGVDLLDPRPGLHAQRIHAHGHTQVLREPGKHRFGAARIGRGGHVVGDTRPQTQGRDPGLGEQLLQDPRHPGGALVLGGLDTHGRHALPTERGTGQRHRPRVGDIGEVGAQQNDLGCAEGVDEIHELRGEGAPSQGRLRALHQQHVVGHAVRTAGRDDDARPFDRPGHPVRLADDRPLIQVVEEFVAADLRDLPGLHVEREMLDRPGRHVRCVVPALERHDHDRVLQIKIPVRTPFDSHQYSLRPSHFCSPIHWGPCLSISIRPCWMPRVGAC